jgi:hypothetical protein
MSGSLVVAAAPAPLRSDSTNGPLSSDAAAHNALLGADEIVNHPRLVACIRQQASTLLSLHSVNPRIASVFATQQRWLMAHAALAFYFRSAALDAASGLKATQFIEAIASHGVASRNTADAFLKEMMKYGHLQKAPAGSDRRMRPLEPTSISIEMISAWLVTHLATLDMLDGGERRAAFLASPGAVALIHPLIADRLLRTAAIREPAPAFSLFTWLNEGGIVMDWLYAGLAEVAPDCQRIPSTVASFADLGERIKLSRTHLTRKLRMAEDMGNLGWLGARGKSIMWVSAEFVREYHRQQSIKLAIIDGAFREAIASRSG